MNYHDELLGKIGGIISGEIRCDRKTRRQITKDLKVACIEAADGGGECNLGFFYEAYKALATKSRGWDLVRSSGFRARANQIIRQYGVSSAVFALVGLGAFLETRRHRSVLAERVIEASENIN